MIRKGNCYVNAAIKSFWNRLKHELIFRCTFRTRDEAKETFLITSRASIIEREITHHWAIMSTLYYELNLSYLNY